MSDKQVVLAIFADEAAADAAVESLKTWAKDSHEKLDAIGVLVLDTDGKVKDHKLGKHTVGKGSGIGLVLALATPVGLAAGVLAGGVAGTVHANGLGLTDDNREELGLALTDGKAAVGVLADLHEADALFTELTQLGGTVKLLPMSRDALDAAALDFPSLEASDSVAAPARGG